MTLRVATACLTLLIAAGVAAAVETPATSPAPDVLKMLPDLKTPEGVSTGLQWLVWITLLSVAPAILVMATCFTRIIVVLGLLRQALTTQNMPPNQVLFGLALLMTVVLMAPVYNEIHSTAIGPHLKGEMSRDDAVAVGERTIHRFMARQIDRAGNSKDVLLFLDDETAAKEDITYKDVPLMSLIPAFVISELKVAFLIGFRIFLPFLVIDLLVASVLVSMGMLMLPPVLISLPLKLLLRILADGWHLVIGTLMRSFG